MKNSSLRKNTYFVGIGQISQKILAFALIPIAARYLGDSGFGKFSLASTLMFFIFLLNDLGINTYVTREVARNRDLSEKYFSNSLVIKMSLIAVNYALLLIFLRFANYSHDTNVAIIIFAGYGIATSVFQLSIGIYEAFEKMEYEAIILGVEKVLVTGIGFWVLLNGYGLVAFCNVFLGCGIFSIILSVFILFKFFHFKKSIYKANLSTIKDIVKNSLPFGISLFIATIYNNVGVLILSLMKSPEVVAWFSASFKFIAITNIIPTILVTTTYPVFSRELNSNRERVIDIHTRCIKYLTFIAVPMIVGTIMLSKQIVLLVFGDQFSNSIITLQILVWAAAFVMYSLFFTGILKAANLQKLMVKIQLIGLGINMVLNIILIYYYSYIGAAITTVITEAFIIIAFVIIIFKRLVRLTEFSFIAKTVLSTLLMAVFCYYCRNQNIFIIISGAIVIYFSLLYVMKGFSFKEFLLLSMKSEQV
jgi:O-antigen/teichoic acid export membrane protein